MKSIERTPPDQLTVVDINKIRGLSRSAKRRIWSQLRMKELLAEINKNKSKVD